MNRLIIYYSNIYNKFCMKITNKQIFLFLLLLIIGALYSRYINKLNKETQKEEYNLIHKYLWFYLKNLKLLFIYLLLYKHT